MKTNVVLLKKGISLWKEAKAAFKIMEETLYESTLKTSY
jgi:hypothetical protein